MNAEDTRVKFIPIYDDDIKPTVGKCFSTLIDAEAFYRSYGSSVGFDTRLAGTKTVDGVILWRYVVCSREGHKFIAARNKGESFEDVNNRRKRVSTRCGCPARVSFKYVADRGYVIHDLVEEHNHDLVDPKYKHLMKANQNLDDIHRKFILDCAKVNIGPTHAHKLLAELLGGLESVGCTVVDVRNFSRDMKEFVDGSDAQMMLNQLKKRKEIYDAFVYEYEIDEEERLKRLFWCDPISRKNYHMFGDVVSFDTTYSTNKYCMIFAPFIRKDNHDRPITFAAGLLSNEDAESFTWLFERFMDCMKSMPKLIITDQDLGMKAAIKAVLKDTRHRWCMWHIMLKLADKISTELRANKSFKKDLNSAVWSDLIEPPDFELSWHRIMNEYGLEKDSWFISMFKARRFWVPAFFRDFPMGGLLRTTSISESKNSFFKRYTRSTANLMDFWMQYNHALESQRHNSDKLNYLNDSSIPTLITKMSNEKHAASIYTIKIFGMVQEEIMAACFSCRMIDMNVSQAFESYTIKDQFDKEYVVLHSKDDNSYACGCKMFSRLGILCSHVFFMFKNKDITCIPDAYVCGRWMKLSKVEPVHEVVCDDVVTFVGIDEKKQISNNAMASFFRWHQKFDGNVEKMTAFLNGMNNVGKSIDVGDGEEMRDPASVKKRAFQNLYGGPPLEKIEVRPPQQVKTKGSGSRLVSRMEAAIREYNKPMRRCNKCNQLARHDARNCDKVKKAVMEKEA